MTTTIKVDVCQSDDAVSCKPYSSSYLRKRTPEELSELRPQYEYEYLSKHAGSRSSFKQKLLHQCAISPLVSDAAFRHIFVAITFADSDGTNFWVGNDRMAILLNRNSRFIERTNAELDKLGVTETVRRVRNKPSVRRFSLSEKIMACAEELYSMLPENPEPTPVSVANDSQPTPMSENLYLKPSSFIEPKNLHTEKSASLLPQKVLKTPAAEMMTSGSDDGPSEKWFGRCFDELKVSVRKADRNNLMCGFMWNEKGFMAFMERAQIHGIDEFCGLVYSTVVRENYRCSKMPMSIRTWAYFREDMVEKEPWQSESELMFG